MNIQLYKMSLLFWWRILDKFQTCIGTSAGFLFHLQNSSQVCLIKSSTFYIYKGVIYSTEKSYARQELCMIDYYFDSAYVLNVTATLFFLPPG